MTMLTGQPQPPTRRRRRNSPVATPEATAATVQSSSSRFVTGVGGSASFGGPSLDGGALAPLVLQIASVADMFTPWGLNPRIRDLQLRSFWPTETLLAGAVYTVSARNAAFNFALRGPRAVTSAVLQMLHEANFGEGWMDFVIKASVDLYTTDNGSFMEVIRPQDSPDSPVVGIAHLDSWRCRRTGRWDAPVVYTDLEGRDHLLKWYQAIALTEFPSPIAAARGLQYCALTRVLRDAQAARDIAIYMSEKVTGRNPKAIHLVTGFTQRTIEDALRLAQVADSDQGLTRYAGPRIIAQPDPTAKAAVETINLASLPDSWDPSVFFNQYVAKLALTFGVDYQDLAPLPGGNLGTSAQSQILHLKSRGKGPGLFMKLMEHKLNFHGVIPRLAKFEYDPHDVESEKEEAELLGMQARAIGGLIQALDLPNLPTAGPPPGTGRGQGQPGRNETSTGAAWSNKVASEMGGLPVPETPAEIADWAMRVRRVGIQVLNDMGIISSEYMAELGLTDQSPSRIVTDSGETDPEPTPAVKARDNNLRLAAEVARHLRSIEPRTRRTTLERDSNGRIAGTVETVED